MSRQAIILAGGLGTRLRARLGDLPKPMIPMGGKPLLEHHITLARDAGLSEILVFACYRADLIENYFGDGSKFGIRMDYIVEESPLGTAGAVLAAFDRLAPTFLVLYGDTMVNVDLDRLWQAHEREKPSATLFLHPNDHPLDSDLVEVDEKGAVKRFHNRPHPAGAWFQNLVNAGLYVMEKESLADFQSVGGSLDFGKDIFPKFLSSGRRLMGYHTFEYIKDIGTPDRYDRISAELKSGLVAQSSLRVPHGTVFLDRDGTLNEEMDGITAPEKLELFPGVGRAIHDLNHHGFRVVLVTNQPVIAKGFCDEAAVRKVHDKLETLLGADHAFLDRIYLCPHHPHKGFPGERPELKMECDCRKPNPGMVFQAQRELNIDLRRSWFIGDSTTDIETARNAGVRSILVRTGYGGRDGRHAVTPDFVFDNLADSVRFLLTSD